MMASRAVLKNIRELILFSVVLAILLVTAESEKRSAARSINVNKDGIVTSPNYPGSYPNNYEGFRKFEVPPEHKLTLVFDYFDLEYDSDCSYDYVAIFDGPLESHSLLGKFCGNEKPPPIIKTTAGEMLMIFRSDGGVVRKGFKVTHTTEFNLKAVVSRENERYLTQYFLNTRRQNTHTTNKWGMDITRSSVALFLTDPQFFAAGNETGEEITYELTLQLMSKLVMKKQISTKDLAWFVNAMTVACIDPKKFFGLDIVAGLRKHIDSTNHTNPFFLLSLCIGGGNMTTEDFDKLHQLFDAHLLRSWTGTQAMVVMALKCISRKSQINVDARIIDEMVLKLKEKQQHNGTIENLKTTALVIQALLATNNYKNNFNMSMAIKSLLKDMKHKNLSAEKFFYILPVIKWKTLLDVNSNHCGNFVKTDLEEMKKLTPEHPDERIQVQISIIIGDDMDFSRTWRIKVPKNYSLYQVMENITNPENKVEYTFLEGKPFIADVNNYENSVETGLSWLVYTKKLSTSDDMVLVEKSPVDVQVGETDEWILWYRSRP